MSSTIQGHKKLGKTPDKERTTSTHELKHLIMVPVPDEMSKLFANFVPITTQRT